MMSKLRIAYVYSSIYLLLYILTIILYIYIIIYVNNLLFRIALIKYRRYLFRKIIAIANYTEYVAIIFVENYEMFYAKCYQPVKVFRAKRTLTGLGARGGKIKTYHIAPPIQ